MLLLLPGRPTMGLNRIRKKNWPLNVDSNRTCSGTGRQSCTVTGFQLKSYETFGDSLFLTCIFGGMNELGRIITLIGYYYAWYLTRIFIVFYFCTLCTILHNK